MRDSLAPMAAQRDPEAPRLSAGLTLRVLDAPIGDGDALSEAELSGVSCAGRHIDGLECIDAVLRDPDMSGTELRDCTFRDTAFRNPNLATARILGGSLTRVAFDGGRLTGLQVAEADVRDVVWRGCGADMATFRHARLLHVSFQDCSLREADFSGMRGEVVRFTGCDLRGASFRHAELAGCEVRRCRLDDIEGVEGLRGASLEVDQLIDLAPALARAMGIGVLSG
jgi:uncharacterized protein YjbI with pentapeptide repeats